MICTFCKKDSNTGIWAKPSRHLTSPSKTHVDDLYFCTNQERKEYDRRAYPFWADLDRNASDSTCFMHERWEGQNRVGTCKITGEKVSVEPLMPGNNSGQPKACIEHFVARK